MVPWARAPAEGGEAAQASADAPAVVPDAADVGRPHAWHEVHTVTAVLVRRGAKEARQLVSAPRMYGMDDRRIRRHVRSSSL